MALLDSWTGRRFRHLKDGREGTMVKTEQNFAIEYELRNEKLQEPITQQKLIGEWTSDLRPSVTMREEEITKVADIADRALRACVMHEPYLFHEMPIMGHEVFDSEFHGQVKDFLRGKYND